MSLPLPSGVTVLERGWLSSNNILLRHPDNPEVPACLVDTGYATHAEQTVALVRSALAGQPLAEILNTHMHSDHVGGNAALQTAFGARCAIPPGEADAVAAWDAARLNFSATGQQCERFEVHDLLHPGQTRDLGGRGWQVLAAPGHDPHSVVLFQPDERVLISADALWGNGFGVVFPELANEPGFDEVRATLDLIESLDARIVIPGHGAPFTDVADAIERARNRLAMFESDPQRHALYAGKVLIKFHMMAARKRTRESLAGWMAGTPYFSVIHSRYFDDRPLAGWMQDLVVDLLRSGALREDGGVLHDA